MQENLNIFDIYKRFADSIKNLILLDLFYKFNEPLDLKKLFYIYLKNPNIQKAMDNLFVSLCRVKINDFHKEENILYFLFTNILTTDPKKIYKATCMALAFAILNNLIIFFRLRTGFDENEEKYIANILDLFAEINHFILYTDYNSEKNEEKRNKHKVVSFSFSSVDLENVLINKNERKILINVYKENDQFKYKIEDIEFSEFSKAKKDNLKNSEKIIEKLYKYLKKINAINGCSSWDCSWHNFSNNNGKKKIKCELCDYVFDELKEINQNFRYYASNRSISNDIIRRAKKNNSLKKGLITFCKKLRDDINVKQDEVDLKKLTKLQEFIEKKY